MVFVNFEKAAKFEIVVCCKFKVALHKLIAIYILVYMYSKSQQIFFIVNP